MSETIDTNALGEKIVTVLKTIYDPKYHNLNHHNYRDCKIENFKETINYLLDLNYKVFRVGVKKENFLDINHKNYFALLFLKVF